VAVSHYEVQVDQYVPGDKPWRYVVLSTHVLEEALEKMLSFRDILIDSSTRLEGSSIGTMYEVSAFSDIFVTNRGEYATTTFVTILRIFTE
jgi:hypothetical protein